MLDPRSAAVAAQDPIPGTVNIPLEELPRRTFELPAKTRLVRVVDVGEVADQTVLWLTAHGRSAEKAPASQAVEAGPSRLWTPNEFLEGLAANLSPGLALDLACGTGRDAVYLASLGWNVIAIDVLSDAIDRAQLLASRYLATTDCIEWRAGDAATMLDLMPKMDLVTMFFFLDRDLIRRAVCDLKPGAHIMLETFTTVHRQRFGRPNSAKLTLNPGEIQALAEGCEVIHHSEEWRESGRHTVRFLGRKT